MTSIEIAKDFVKTMNPNLSTGESVNFWTYSVPLADKSYNMELRFVEEHFDDGNESDFHTMITLTDKDWKEVDYTFAETLTDARAIANSIIYLVELWEVML